MTTPLKGNKFLSILNLEIFDTKQLSFKTLFFIHWKMSKKTFFRIFKQQKDLKNAKLPFSPQFRNFWATNSLHSNSFSSI